MSEPSTEQLLEENRRLRQQVETLQRERTELEQLLQALLEQSNQLANQFLDKAAASSEQGRKQLEQFLDALPVGIFVVDAQGKPYYANHKAQEILGPNLLSDLASGQLIRRYRAYTVDTHQLYPVQQQPIVRALRGETVNIEEMEVRTDERTLLLEVRATPIFATTGEVAYAITAFEDITARKQAEAERERYISSLLDLTAACERFVPRQFLQFLDKTSIADVTLGDQVQKEMSIMFADIVSFTSLSEQMTPRENFQFINTYLSYMEPCIMAHHGFIDKYIGDAIMALFNRHADDAVKAGIAMLQTLEEYNHSHRATSPNPVQIGIGINTGSLMLGTIGGAQRMDSTVISDAVNLAARLEKLTRQYGVKLLIGHQTFCQLQHPEHYAIRKIDQVQVKGKSELVTVYEVFDADPTELRQGKLATAEVFATALSLYEARQFRQAIDLFFHCTQQNPGDTVAHSYLERAHELRLRVLQEL